MFKQLASVSESSSALLERCRPVGRTESISLDLTLGRVLSYDIASPVNLPGFNRAAMDGYAVRSEDTRGASLLNPVYLDLEDESGQSRCAPVRTGMPVPEAFDAVVMKEDVVLRGDLLEISAEVHPHRNLAQIGEDVKEGDLVFEKGHVLRSPDIALLASFGMDQAEVWERPRVAIIPTGNELAPSLSGQKLRPGQAYETNGIMAELYVRSWGGIPLRAPIVEDDPAQVKEAILANQEADLILLIGGTSVGEKDYVPPAVAELGEILAHGVRLSPGKPTALGLIDETPVVCLPGYSVAALAALFLFVRPLVKKLAHLRDDPSRVKAMLAEKIVSRPGYITFARVILDGDRAAPIMTTGAGILSSVAKAGGYVLVPEEMEGIEEGKIVEVNLF